MRFLEEERRMPRPSTLTVFVDSALVHVEFRGRFFFLKVGSPGQGHGGGTFGGTSVDF